MALLFWYFTCPLPPQEGHVPIFFPPREGPFLALSKPSSRKQAGKDSLPVWTAAGSFSWGGVGRRGKKSLHGLLEGRKATQEPSFALFCTSVYSVPQFTQFTQRQKEGMLLATGIYP